jgi:hypothetical protein
MDSNKLQKLRELHYEIKECCGTCKHCFISLIGTGVWGDCLLHSYDHLKHEKNKPLSINQFGHCESFEWNLRIIDLIGNWKEFLEK